MADQTTYRERWAKASFRNFEFFTDSHEAKGGRRLVVHEFPGAEQPQVEDLGGKAWDWQLNAYFIGDQYDRECNGLLAKLNEPGASWLLHPWLGWIWVRAHQWSRHESSDKNGFCTLSIEFAPGGAQPFAIEPDKVDVAIDRTHKLGDAAQDDFELEPMSADGMTAFVAAVQGGLDVLRNVISLATLPLTWAQQIMGVVASVKGELSALAALPGAYASALRGLANSFGLGATGFSGLFGTGDGRAISSSAVSSAPVFSDATRVRLVSRLAVMATTTGACPLTGVAAVDPVVRRNLARESALRCRLFLVAAAQVAIADYQSEAARDEALACVLVAFEVLLPSLPDPVFQAALSARTAFIEALMAQDLKPQAERDVVHLLPATLLAHCMEVDESVFLEQNKVRHPLFVQGRVRG